MDPRLGFEPTLSSSVEAITGRKVVAFMSANHVSPDFAVEVFVLDDPIIGGSNEAPRLRAIIGSEAC